MRPWLRSPRRSGESRERRAGQSIAEFALTLPLLIIILLLAIDMGRLFFGWVALQNTSRIGANFAASNPDAWAVSGDPRQAEYAQEIQHDASTINCALPSPIPTPQFPDSTQIGDRAVVSLTCNFQLLTPLLSGLIGNPVTLGATTTYPIRAGIVGLPVPTPTPSATPPPSATPTPSAGPCTVPLFLTGGKPAGNPMKANDAGPAWTAAGFVSTNLTVSIGSGNYSIRSESPSGVDGTQQDCATFTMVVGP